MRNGPKLALKRDAMLAAIRRVQPPQPWAQAEAFARAAGADIPPHCGTSCNAMS